MQKLGVGDLLSIDRESIGIGNDVQVDTRAFATAVDGFDHLKAARLYRGPFAQTLPGFSDEVDDLIDQARRRFHSSARSVFFQLRDALELESAAQLATRLLTLDELDWEVRRAQISLMAKLGQPEAAEACLREAEERWRLEFATDWPHVAELATILRGSSTIVHSAIPFVGRDNETASLLATWKEVEKGSMQRILIRGESGIGKSALADRFRRLLVLRGGKTYWAIGHPLEKKVPLAVVSQWLEGGHTSREFSSAGPALPPEYQSARLGRRRLFATLAQELLHNQSPTAFFVDDLHWADDLSLSFLGYLQREHSATSILIVGVVSDGVESPNLDLLRGFTVLDLNCLNLDDVVKLCARYRGQDDPALAGKLCERTGGNPLLLSALLSERHGDLDDSESIPTSVLEFLGPKVASLSAEGRFVLSALGLLGAALVETIELLAPYPEAVQGAIQELSEAGLLRDRGEKIEPRHGLIAEVCLRHIGPVAERQLRGRAARLLAESDRLPPASSAPQFDLAGHRELAHTAALQAADGAAQIFAHQEAEYFYRIALANAPNIWAEYKVRSSLADVHLAQGQFAAALAVLAEQDASPLSASDRAHLSSHQLIVRLLWCPTMEVVNSAVQHLSKGAETPLEVTARLAMAVAISAHALGHREETLASIAVVQDLLPSIQDQHLRIRIAMRMGVLVAMYRSAHEGVGFVDKYMGEAARWPDTLAVGLAARGSVRVSAGLSHEAEADLLASLQLMETTSNYDPMFMVANNLGALYQEQGRFEEAKQLFDRALAVSDDPELGAQVQVAYDNLAILAYERDEWEEVLRMAQTVLSRVPASELSRRSRLTLNSLRGLSFFALGKKNAAFEVWHAIEDDCGSLDYDSNDISYVEMFAARIAQEEGNGTAAVKRIESIIERYRFRDFFCTSRLQVERLRLLLSLNPRPVLAESHELRLALLNAGARPLVERLDSILTRARLAMA